MKPIAIIFINALLLASFSMQAQEDTNEDEEPEVAFNTFGLFAKAGFNFAAATKASGTTPPDARTSIYIGGGIEVPVVKNIFSVQAEALYSGQGFERNYSFEGKKYQTLYKLDYITVPVLAKYYVLKGFSLEAGPQFSFLANHKIDSSLDEIDREKEQLNHFDAGFAAGVTFQFNSGLFINGRYNRGLRAIFENYEGKNMAIQFGLGYKF